MAAPRGTPSAAAGRPRPPRRSPSAQGPYEAIEAEGAGRAVHLLQVIGLEARLTRDARPLPAAGGLGLLAALAHRAPSPVAPLGAVDEEPAAVVARALL